MNNEIKECEYQNICVNFNDNLYSKCPVFGWGNECCYAILYKQLLSEQAKNKELETTLESFRKANDKKNEFLQQLGINAGGEFNRIKYYIDNLQAKNKKLVEALEKIENCWNNIDSDKFAGHRLYITLTQALNEVNK